MKTTTPPLVSTYPQYPFELQKGEGVYVTTTTGERYLDLYGGHAVAGLGHGRSEITKAISDQASQLFFYSNLTPLSVRTEAAEDLITFADSHLSSVFFCNSGAEANENALKLAVQKTGRSRLVSFYGGWHGRTTMAAAVTDDPKWHAKTVGWTGDVLFLDPTDEKELLKIDSSCAAAIIEPIQSIGGVRAISDSFLAKLRERTTETGTYLIFDEVQTGVGRTGVPYVNGHGLNSLRGSQHQSVSADMSTSAKSLGNGFPVGALLMSDGLAKDIQLGDLGSTYGGGPIASVVVRETLRIISDEKLLENVLVVEEYLRAQLETFSIISEVRGRGCLLGFQLGLPAHIEHPAKWMVEQLRKKHILAGVSGVPEVMRILPPYTVSKKELDIFITALKEIQKELT